MRTSCVSLGTPLPKPELESVDGGIVFALSQLPSSIFRQFGHCIVPFALNTDPMQPSKQKDRFTLDQQNCVQTMLAIEREVCLSVLCTSKFCRLINLCCAKY